jgi:hypothetical protein
MKKKEKRYLLCITILIDASSSSSKYEYKINRENPEILNFISGYLWVCKDYILIKYHTGLIISMKDNPFNKNIFIKINMSYRSKRLIQKFPTCEQDLLIFHDDHQITRSLASNSKWLIIRNNIHKIRSWKSIRRLSVIEQPIRDWYVFIQIKHELKHVQKEIRALEYRTDFIPVRYFNLPIDQTHVRRYNVSHIQSTDEIYYGGLGSEPIVLQYLLYYFSKECLVPYNSIFYSFLSDVNAVLDTNRQRLQRAVVFRRVVLIFTLAISIILFIMLFSLILSVLTTISNLRQMYEK